MAKQAKQKQQDMVAKWRLLLVAGGLLLLSVLLVWRTLSLQILDTGHGRSFLQGQGDARTIRTEKIPAHRGMITDRNGEPLAVSTPVASIWVDPSELVQASERIPELAGLLKMNSRELARRVSENASRRFMYLRRQMAPADAQQIVAAKIKGVYVQREYRRFYPAGEVVSHLLGFTDIDDQGQEGLELAYDSWLIGEAGSKRVLKDLYGNVIRDLDDGKAARAGSDLQLTIDLRLQYVAYRELKAALKRSQAKAGTIVMLDVHSGEVLAMVNQPGFNPNNRSDLNVAALRNRAVIDMFEPGSTVKPFTVAAALASGKFQANSVIDTSPGYVRVGSKTLLDPINYGRLDMQGILRKSSQVGISKLSLELSPQTIWEVFQSLGLGRATGSGFPGESNGMLPNRINWRPIERANFAFGYGLSVTTLQLAQAYTVLASGGMFHPVTLIRQEHPQTPTRVMDQSVATQVLEMLEAVTQKGGTGTRAAIKDYRVAGKTGTVHKVGNDGYARDRYLSLFAGVAPVTNPSIVAVVTIDEPGNGHYYGGEAAAPVFSRVAGEALRLMNIAPDSATPLYADQAHVADPDSV